MSLIKIDQAKLAEKQLAQQLGEYKAYLTNTDHKFLVGYTPKEGEDLSAIEATRNEYREFIRENEA